MNTIATRMWLLATTMVVVSGVLQLTVGDLMMGSRAVWAAALLELAIGVVLGGLLSWLLARAISRPITEVAEAAAVGAAKNVPLQVKIAGGATHEIADLVENFNRMAAHLRTVNRERLVFAAGIAHELRTPLTVLKGRLHGLEDGVIEPSTGEAARLLRQADQLLRLVDDLGTLAHAHAGELRLDLRVVELGDVLRAALADIRAAVSPADIQFVEDYDAVRVEGDPARLLQLFVNLMSNAAKHTPPGGRVMVSTRVTGDVVATTITDEGPGFSDADTQSLFLPFWRATSSRESGRPGSGLGLALAAKLTELHSGEIAAQNRQDRSGAVFTVFLPVARQQGTSP